MFKNIKDPIFNFVSFRLRRETNETETQEGNKEKERGRETTRSFFSDESPSSQETKGEYGIGTGSHTECVSGRRL